LSLELAPEDAASITTDVLDVHAPIAADKGIELVRDTNLQGVQILADRNRLVQVFGNLIGNSIKFCRADDRIVMHTKVDGNEVCFQIRDTGPGIPADELPRIFEPYWSAERHAKKGTGLGLYISKGIVEAHHGRIWVESTPGSTTFFVALPRVQG
jgi:signal transduction histidine kinase